MRHRRHLLLFLAYFLLSLCAPALAQEAAERASLQNYIDRAIALNPGLASSYKLYQSSIELFRGAGLQPNPDAILSLAQSRYKDDANSLNQPLELFGRPTYRKDSAFCAMRAEEFRYGTDCQGLVQEVSLAFFDALRAHQIRLVEEQNLQLADTFLDAARKRYDAGAIPFFQVLQFRVERSRAESDLDLALTEEKNTLLALNKLVGWSLDQKVMLDDLPCPLVQILPSLTDLQAGALEARPEMALLSWELKGAQAEKKVIISENHPDIILSTYRSNDFTDNSGTYRVTLAVPILDWGNIRSRVKAVERRAEAAEKSQEEQKNLILLETATYYNQVVSCRARLDALNANVVKDQERMTFLMQRGYELGINSYIEALEAQRTLKNVHRQYFDLRAEYQKAMARLEKAAGSKLFQKEGSHNEKP